MSVIKIQLLVKLCQDHRVDKNDFFAGVFFVRMGMAGRNFPQPRLMRSISRRQGPSIQYM
jgi:hypothetical protein